LGKSQLSAARRGPRRQAAFRNNSEESAGSVGVSAKRYILRYIGESCI